MNQVILEGLVHSKPVEGWDGKRGLTEFVVKEIWLEGTGKKERFIPVIVGRPLSRAIVEKGWWVRLSGIVLGDRHVKRAFPYFNRVERITEEEALYGRGEDVDSRQ